MKKRLLKIMAMSLAISFLATGIAGCGKTTPESPAEEPQEITTDIDDEDTDTDEETDVTVDEPEEPEAEPEDPHAGKALNLLNGEWVSQKKAKQRPVAVMMGNTVDALPQFGIGKADVLYEIPVEGGITRLMAIFSDYSDLDAIGSIRSCRLYFAETAAEYDALYVHFGQASNAKSYLASDAIDNINGIDGNVYGLSFYRSSSRKAPHNAFTSTDGITKAVEKLKYDTKYDKDYEGHFKFADPLTDTASSLALADTDKAYAMATGYNHSATYFTYDKESKKYKRFQYKREHVDGSDNTQLAFDNVLFLYMNMKVLDKSGHLGITNTGTGSGQYFSNGKMMDISWQKGNTPDSALFLDGFGNELVINPGKTCICVIDSSATEKVKLYKDEDSFNKR